MGGVSVSEHANLFYTFNEFGFFLSVSVESMLRWSRAPSYPQTDPETNDGKYWS